jgi:dihydrodipicolinate synthase/N-acetylneuraminate lyase
MMNLIERIEELRPETKWSETKWAWTSEESLVDHTNKARLCAAILLPFKNGKPDWEGFVRSIDWMRRAALQYDVEFVPVLNADTGYIFHLSDELYAEVLFRFRQAFPADRFIAGVTARNAERDSGFRADRYRSLLDRVQEYDHCEVMLMTSQRLSALAPEKCRDAYFELAEYLVRPAIVHSLDPAFVEWAKPFGPWLLAQLANHPKFIGGKTSTLDEPHFLYWSAMCSDLKLDFAPHSGDDYGIATAIKLGRPLLIGAAVSAAPLICAAKDMWLDDRSPYKKHKLGTKSNSFDTRVYKLFEAIQSLEDQVFRLDDRMLAASYKHSTAHVLHRLNIIDSPEPHPDCPDVRDERESGRMLEALRRPARIAKLLGIDFFS